MENVYEAMESAGLRLEDMKGSNTSVFAGQFTDDVRSILQEDPDLSVKYKPIGTSAAILAARVSWFYDLRGSSFTLDTACSSSIVALHTGAQDLRAGLSDMVRPRTFSLLPFALRVLCRAAHLGEGDTTQTQRNAATAGVRDIPRHMKTGHAC